MSTILVVDDEAGIRELLQEILHDEGHSVLAADSAEAARRARAAAEPDLVLLDIWMPDADGITLLKEWKARGQLTMPVVMMSGHGTIDTAVEATRIGAFDFLEKPIALSRLLATVDRALKRGRAKQAEGQGLAALGRGRAVQELESRLKKARAVRWPVLLAGEPGSGFLHCARALHEAGTPWVHPQETSWLLSNPAAKLAEAKGGVLYAGDISLLTRLEQRGLALAARLAEKSEVRLITVGTPELFRRVREGSFDAETLALVGRVRLFVPPLSAHREDIPVIAQARLAELVETGTVPPRRFTPAALAALEERPWPGNLEELEAAVMTLAVAALGEDIDADDVACLLAPAAGVTPLPVDLDRPLKEARDAFEKLYFEYHLARVQGNMSRLAEAVGLERTHLYRKLRQLDVALPGRKTD